MEPSFLYNYLYKFVDSGLSTGKYGVTKSGGLLSEPSSSKQYGLGVGIPGLGIRHDSEETKACGSRQTIRTNQAMKA